MAFVNAMGAGCEVMDFHNMWDISSTGCQRIRWRRNTSRKFINCFQAWPSGNKGNRHKLQIRRSSEKDPDVTDLIVLIIVWGETITCVSLLYTHRGHRQRSSCTVLIVSLCHLWEEAGEFMELSVCSERGPRAG